MTYNDHYLTKAIDKWLERPHKNNQMAVVRILQTNKTARIIIEWVDEERDK